MVVLNRSAIKQEARSFLSNDKKWFSMFIAIVAYYILVNASDIYDLIVNKFANFRFGIDYFFDYYQFAGNNSNDPYYSLFGIIAFLMMPFSVAIAGYFLNHLRGFNPSASSPYKEGFENYAKYFAACFMKMVSIFLWALLFVIPGIIKVFEYSQVTYIMHDNKNLKPSQAKKISSLMTNGYKSELFVLELSFIGWYFAGAMTLGLTYIYALPYMNTVRAMYYENLKSNAIERGIVAPEAFMSEPPVYQNYQQTDYTQQPYTSQNDQPYGSSQPVGNAFTSENSQQNGVEQSFSAPSDGEYYLNGELVKKDENIGDNKKQDF